MALEEDFLYMAYRCAYCHHWNPAKKVRPTCRFNSDAHFSPALVEGDCPLSLLVRLVTMRLYTNGNER